MKKGILKIMGLVAVATLMALNIQFTNMDEGSTISLSYLKNLAFAQGGENGGGSQCAYRNETWTEVFGQTVKVCVSGGTGNVPCC